MRRNTMIGLLALLALPACVDAGPGYYGPSYGYAPGWYAPAPAYVAPAPRWGYGRSYGHYRPAPGWRNDGWRNDHWRRNDGWRGDRSGGGWSRPPAPVARDYGGTPRQNALGARLEDQLRSQIPR